MAGAFYGNGKGAAYLIRSSAECDKRRTICVKPSCFIPEFEMVIAVPEDRDTEEYIDELLDSILNEDLRYNAEWDFVDEISRR